MSPARSAPRARSDVAIRGRYRPTLIVAATVVCVPAAALAGPGGGPDVLMLVLGGVLATSALAARALEERMSLVRREAVGTVLIVVTLGLFVVLLARSALPTSAFLGLAAAQSVMMATVRRDRLRTAAQSTTFVAVAVLLVLDVPGRGSVDVAIEVAGPLALLFAVALLAGVLAGDLETARQREIATRQDADRRAELLRAVRTLARVGSDEAADRSVEALLELGFEVAAVGFLEGDRLIPRRAIGLSLEGLGTSYGGQVGLALTRDATIVHADYREAPGAYAHIDLGTVVITPVRVQGRPQGILIAAHRSTGDPAPDDIEVVEVLAAHLGASLQTERSVADQAALLTRLRDLEALRTRFASSVSEDLRDPLTIVQGLAQTLGRHGERLDRARREELLDGLTLEAQSLGATLETLLDFSRLQRDHAEPDLVDVDVVALFAPALAGSGADLDVREVSTVHVDVGLARRAIELLRRGAAGGATTVRFDRDAEGAVIDVLWFGDGGEEGLWRSLAEQLLVLAGGRCERSLHGLRVLVPLAASDAGPCGPVAEVVP